MRLLSAIPISLLLLFGVAVLAAVCYVAGLRRTGIILGSTLLACITYLAVGIAIPRFVHVGHFFSVPFGGYHVTDSRILLSLLFWLVLYVLAFNLVLARRRQKKTRGASHQ